MRDREGAAFIPGDMEMYLKLWSRHISIQVQPPSYTPFPPSKPQVQLLYGGSNKMATVESRNSFGFASEKLNHRKRQRHSDHPLQMRLSALIPKPNTQIKHGDSKRKETILPTKPTWRKFCDDNCWHVYYNIKKPTCDFGGANQTKTSRWPNTAHRQYLINMPRLNLDSMCRVNIDYHAKTESERKTFLWIHKYLFIPFSIYSIPLRRYQETVLCLSDDMMMMALCRWFSFFFFYILIWNKIMSFLAMFVCGLGIYGIQISRNHHPFISAFWWARRFSCRYAKFVRI